MRALSVFPVVEIAAPSPAIAFAARTQQEWMRHERRCHSICLVTLADVSAQLLHMAVVATP